MQVAKRGLVESKPTVLYDRKQMLRTFRQIQDLLLIRNLPPANRYAVEQRLYLGKRERIAFKHARIPHEFRQHPMKAKAHPFNGMGRQVLRDRGAIPLKAEVGEKRHGKLEKAVWITGPSALKPSVGRIYDLSAREAITQAPP
ncbi:MULTISPECIES: hypothetical protein [Paraburkholderia]|uniref:hypothetical protein n=1 Tax=Paraburkholderia TaxID=1822464 RepID=UPI00225808FA|nr:MULTISPECIES: hypothetical protein [Paraburkholderia]MCX4176839.1 hypothetical protein [Paraburkholderia madseniana]MDQ6464830.1 hypothetical protein [Paraburkholderia madseniana]